MIYGNHDMVKKKPEIFLRWICEWLNTEGSRYEKNYEELNELHVHEG